MMDWNENRWDGGALHLGEGAGKGREEHERAILRAIKEAPAGSMKAIASLILLRRSEATERWKQADTPQAREAMWLTQHAFGVVLEAIRLARDWEAPELTSERQQMMDTALERMPAKRSVAGRRGPTGPIHGGIEVDDAGWMG